VQDLRLALLHNSPFPHEFYFEIQLSITAVALLNRSLQPLVYQRFVTPGALVALLPT
jgi:hypothetical protein